MLRDIYIAALSAFHEAQMPILRVIPADDPEFHIVLRNREYAQRISSGHAGAIGITSKSTSVVEWEKTRERDQRIINHRPHSART